MNTYDKIIQTYTEIHKRHHICLFFTKNYYQINLTRSWPSWPVDLFFFLNFLEKFIKNNIFSFGVLGRKRKNHHFPNFYVFIYCLLKNQFTKVKVHKIDSKIKWGGWNGIESVLIRSAIRILISVESYMHFVVGCCYVIGSISFVCADIVFEATCSIAWGTASIVVTPRNAISIRCVRRFTCHSSGSCTTWLPWAKIGTIDLVG